MLATFTRIYNLKTFYHEHKIDADSKRFENCYFIKDSILIPTVNNLKFIFQNYHPCEAQKCRELVNFSPAIAVINICLKKS